MSKYKIVISDYYYPNLDEEMKEFSKLGDDVEIVDCTKIREGGIFEPEELIPFVRDCDSLIVQFAKVTKEVIDSMKRCRVIARYAIGVDNIDLEEAWEKNIFVSNVPDYCIDEVADTAIAHMLNAVRKISYSRDLLLKNDFDISKLKPGIRMSSSTLGLVGFGHIARNVADKMKNFVKNIVVYDPYFTKAEDYPDFQFVSLNGLLAVSDIISIHVPLNDETRHMISDEQFGKMKDNVVLVNTARGGLIDENALVRAIKAGKVNFAGLDVAETEDFSHSNLLHEEKIALTPHMAWYSEEALQELQRKVAANVVHTFLDGKPVYYISENIKVARN